MCLEMVHLDHGDAPSEGKCLHVRDAHEEGADQTGTRGHGHRLEVDASDGCLVEGASDDRADQLDVGPARQFGHDPAEAGVQVRLARHHR